MEIRSLCPFSVGTLLWEAQPGQLSLSVVVKATFSLVPDGEAVPATEQAAIAGDVFWDNDAQGSLYCPSDRAPVKRRVDVILSGHAYAPGGAPVESLIAKLKVGDFAKAVRVTGDRVWTRPGGGAGGLVQGRPIPFVRMPLRYDRAARNPDNPAGIEPDAPPSLGQFAGPNIEPLEAHGMPGFGPVSPTWPSRRILLPDAALSWAYAVTADRPAGPVPHNFNFEFFNAAPRDQQIDLLRAGAVIELECLHPRLAHLRTSLPPIRPQVFRTSPGAGRTEEIVLRCDTLWIDSDRSVAVVSFRGLTDLGGMDRAAVGELLVVVDPQGKKLRFDKVEKQLRERVATGGDADPLALRHDAVKPSPLSPPAEQTARLEPAVDQTRQVAEPPRRAPLPFVKSAAKGAGAAKEASAPKEASPPEEPSAAKAAAAPPVPGGDGEVNRTKDIGQLPRRATLPFQQRIAAASAKRAEAGPARPPPRRAEPPRPVGSPPRPVEVPPRVVPVTGAEEPDPDAITAEKEKKAPRGPLGALPAKPALVSLPDPAPPSASAESKPAPEPPPEPEQLGYREKKPPALPAGEAALPAAVETTAPLQDKTTEPEADPDPAKVPIEEYAAILAELAQKGVDRGAVLAGHKRTAGGWAAIDRHWTRAIAEQTERGERTLLTSFDEAYVATQGRLRRLIGVPEYARILVGLERGEVGRVLADLELQLSDLMRLQRVWTKKIADAPKLAAELGQAVEAARRG